MRAIIFLYLALIAHDCTFASPNDLKPKKNLTPRQKLDFWVGAGLFRSPWVAAPASTKGRDGLGPLFNARSCDACHRNGSAGEMPIDGLGLVVRVSEYDEINKQYLASPTYGSQIQTLSIKSFINGHGLPAEAEISIQQEPITLDINGDSITLIKNTPVLTQLNYGDFKNKPALSIRLAPPLFGLGLIDEITDAQILKNEDIDDKNKDGISGKANYVWDIENQKQSIGRFGYKAEQPSILQQVASALNEDIGLTSWIYPKETCTPAQERCLKYPSGTFKSETVEVSPQKLNLMTEFSKNLAAPSSAERSLKNTRNKGFDIFKSIGCSDCHIPTLNTEDSTTNTQVFTYTDLLLHDMGEPLADARPAFNATGREWRTTPLWGLSKKLKQKKVHLLHDGRATNVEQAILWHAGEALNARNKYWATSTKKKQKLLQFLNLL